MNWLLNRSTRTKLFLGFGLVLSFLLVVIVAAYSGVSSIQASQKTLYEDDFADVSDLQEMLANQDEVRSSMLNMMLVGNRAEQEALRQLIGQIAKRNSEIMAKLIARNRDDVKALASLEQLSGLRKQFGKIRDQEIIPLIYQGKIEQARQLSTADQGGLFVKIPAVTKALIEQHKEQAHNRVNQAELGAAHSVQIFAAVGAAALVAGMFMVLLLNRMIAYPLKEIANRAQQIAAGDIVAKPVLQPRLDEIGVLEKNFNQMAESLQEKAEVARQIATGDLTVRVTPQSERDMLGNAFVVMVNNLSDMNREINEGVNVLASSASEILAGTTQIASAAEQSAASITETTSTVEEVKQTAYVSSQKAKTVSETAQKTVQVSQSGKKAMGESIEAMQRIQEQMESVAESIVRLSEQSQAIGEIITTVNDLAEQSNLLAVNAAIEAAKAGDQGKGFAVVAQEVKSLSTQSKQATSQVRAILGDIQKATSGAVMATEQGSKAVEAGVKLSGEVGESIRVLAESIEDAAQAATQIAASAQQQLAGMDQVALAMQNIKVATTQSVASTKQAEIAAHNLHGLGQKLKQLVEQYRV